MASILGDGRRGNGHGRGGQKARNDCGGGSSGEVSGTGSIARGSRCDGGDNMTNSCSINLLESALDGSLRADDEVALQHHLEECESCSAVLENMAGWTEWCKEASTLLTEDELDELNPSREDWAVDFTVEHLEPSENSDAIGRLGEFDVLEVIGQG